MFRGLIRQCQRRVLVLPGLSRVAAVSRAAFSNDIKPEDEFTADDGEGFDLGTELGDLGLDLNDDNINASLSSLNFGTETATQTDDFSDVLDPKDPPKLTMAHYRMIRDLGALGRLEAQDKSYYGHKKNTPDLTIPDPAEQYEGVVSNVSPLRYGEWMPYREGTSFMRDLNRKPKWLNPMDVQKKGECLLCKKDPTPDKKLQLVETNVELLHHFLNERGMITPRVVNNNCAKHQRALARVVRRARDMGFLSYTSNWKPALRYAYGIEVENAVKAVAEQKAQQRSSLSGRSRMAQKALESTGSHETSQQGSSFSFAK